MMEQSELEQMVLDLKGKIDSILETVSNSEKEYNYNKGLEGFKQRNSKSLSPYYEKLKKLNGDDFDLAKAAFDEYNNTFSDIEESTYVAQLVSEIENKISKLREALGEDEVEIESDDEKTEVKTHDTEIETNTGSDVVTDKTEEKEEPKDEEEEDVDEVAEFEKELEADLNKYKK